MARKRQLPAGQPRHRGGQRVGEAGLRQRPGHRGGAAHDQQDGAGQRRRVHQHRVDPPPVELPVHQQPDHDRVGDADGARPPSPSPRPPPPRRGSRTAAAAPGSPPRRRATPRGPARAPRPQVLPPAARRAIRPSTAARNSPGSSPAVNSPAIDTDVTEPITISTMEGGIVSLIAPEAASRATSSPSSAPRRFISGNSTGATAAMSAALEPLMPRHQQDRADQHVGQPAAHVAHQRRQERHQHPRHARHLHQLAQQHEQRHRQQDERAHALVHAADHDGERGAVAASR